MVKIAGKKLVKKKKNWIAVYGSNNYENLFLGETLGEKPEDLMGRIIEANLGEVTKEIKRQNVKLLFKVNEIKEGRVKADIIGYEIMPGYLRRSKNWMDYERKTAHLFPYLLTGE